MFMCGKVRVCMCVCVLYVWTYPMHIYIVHVCVEAEVNVKNHLPSIATIFIEAGSLNQTQSSQI